MKSLVRALLPFLISGAACAQTPLSWEALAQVQLVPERKVYLPRFGDAVLRLDAQEVRLQGYMLPLGVGDKQTHFLLSANPSECSFCLSGGPESIVEVRARSGFKYSIDAIAVKGRLELVKNEPGGSVFYRLHDAVPAPKFRGE